MVASPIKPPAGIHSNRRLPGRQPQSASGEAWNGSASGIGGRNACISIRVSLPRRRVTAPWGSIYSHVPRLRVRHAEQWM